jgi:hypothetical protein
METVSAYYEVETEITSINDLEVHGKIAEYRDQPNRAFPAILHQVICWKTIPRSITYNMEPSQH